MARKSTTSDTDPRLWGTRPVRWGLRMLELGGPLLIGTFSSDDCRQVAAFLGLDRSAHAKEGLPEQIMQAAGKRQAQLRGHADLGSTLSRNLNHLKKSFDFNAVELEIIAFRAMLRLHPGFAALANHFIGECIDLVFHQRLAAMFAVPAMVVANAFDPKGALCSSGIARVEEGLLGPTDHRIFLIGGLISRLVRPSASTEQLLASLLPCARTPRLQLDDYPHLRDEIRLLRQHLTRAISAHSIGVNVLLHGRPGTGKTELAAALATSLDCPLYELSSNHTQDLPSPRDRFSQIRQTQRLISVTGRGLLLIDEAEDLFPGRAHIREQTPAKSAVNECMEHNIVPTIWISNRGHDLDEAFLRRFDLVIHMQPLPASAKRTLLRTHFAPEVLDDKEVHRYADQRELTPAVLSRMALVARNGGSDEGMTIHSSMQILSRHYLQTLGVSEQIPDPTTPMLIHDLTLLNTDIPLDPIIAGLAATQGGARVLLHGPPGTGKTALGHAIATRLDRPLLQRQASSLLSAYVGETEHKLRDMFLEARRENAVLLLDEADSFLGERAQSRARWEVTQTNELLTQMEAYEGIFICTTNRLDQLEPAALRRFDLKVGFAPLRFDQGVALVRQCCSQLAIAWNPEWDNTLPTKISRLTGLTPGDAAAALRRLRLAADTPTVDLLLEALATECSYKPTAHRAIGFLA